MTAARAEAAAGAAECAARLSYGRVLSILARAWTDVDAAEDALSDAFRRALETWPKDGVTDKPEAWLLVTARHRLTDEARSRTTRRAAQPTLRLLADEAASARRPVDGGARL